NGDVRNAARGRLLHRCLRTVRLGRLPCASQCQDTYRQVQRFAHRSFLSLKRKGNPLALPPTAAERRKEKFVDTRMVPGFRAYFDRSHNRSVLSELPERARPPSEEKAILQMLSVAAPPKLRSI